MKTQFTKYKNQWAIRSDRYLKTGSRVEVQKKNGEVSIVVVGGQLERPRGVQRHGDFIFAITR